MCGEILELLLKWRAKRNNLFRQVPVQTFFQSRWQVKQTVRAGKVQEGVVCSEVFVLGSLFRRLCVLVSWICDGLNIQVHIDVLIVSAKPCNNQNVVLLCT
jgi:hypothetical protein